MPESAASSLMPVEQALTRLLDEARPRLVSETVALAQAGGRVLFEEIVAACDVPPWHNSAMDGYAVDSRSLRTDAPLVVSQRIPAGVAPEALVPATAARIFTGAPMPEGADAVVMQENCRMQDGQVVVTSPVASGENVRRQGADVARGSTLLQAGHRLRPQDIGLLAATGHATVQVGRRPSVALMTTGDELVEPGQPLRPGQIYNSNFYTLAALLRALGIELIDAGRVPDTLAETETALRQAAQQADCIITSGGVSAGEEDHVRSALQRCGELAIWKLALKPGKPFAFGKIDGSLLFGLPGNPVSAFVTFLLLVRPALLAMMGATDSSLPERVERSGFALPVSGPRQVYLRVCLQGGAGDRELQVLPDQSSGVLSSVSRADGLAIIPPFTAVAPGDQLRFLSFSDIVY
ncbi:gephyrin-like molybdotransferase Glp [Pseudohongiella sp.]|uniref:molybdopterin molybdotransferase n=1 Tax=marine sediment metagenome TaxID=412755 RepID=A0A0F9VJQ4_9ZZZZ|nr:gephyrin-like molybdotransferase Glp [Pseudohongiella sp.]